jgi:hypothetical protein
MPPDDAADGASEPPAAGPAFAGRTPRKSEAVRAGMIVGTGLVLVLGAAVAMGASPAPSSATGAGATPGVQADPGRGTGNGGRGAFGPMGPFGAFGPFGGPLPGGPGKGFGRGGRGGPGDHGGQGLGTISVSAIDGSSLSLKSATGWTRTIDVPSTATITNGGAPATLIDIKVGDTIRFAERRDADGTTTITAVAIVQPQVAGTVTAVGAETITITLRDGATRTIATNGSTTYRLERDGGARSDVGVGSMIVATGQKASDGTMTATSIWVRLAHVAGTVETVTTDAITITGRDGSTTTIHVSDDTTVRVAGVEKATIADVKAGMVIGVEGKGRADGSIDARAIGAGDVGRGWGHGGKPGKDPNASPAPDASGSTTG